VKVRKFIYIGGSALAFLAVLTLDLIRKNFEFNPDQIGTGVGVARGALVIAAFALLYLYFDTRKLYSSLVPAKRLSLIMIYSVIASIACAIIAVATDNNFDTKGDTLSPLTYGAIFIATISGVGLGIFSLLVFRLLRGLILFRRKKGTERNLLIYILLALATSASTLFMDALESSVLTGTLFGFAILFAVVNSFRLPWIVYLTKREKIIGLIYGLLAFIALSGLNAMLNMKETALKYSLLYYSHPLAEFILLTGIFANVYFGMAFISTLFHLPTAEAFDRKTTEVSSLHNLSRLVTQVFNFDELVETVTSMTLQVCEAKSCWLEVIHYADERERTNLLTEENFFSNPDVGNYIAHLAGRKNIERLEIHQLLSAGERTLRDEVLEEKKPLVVDDLARDGRFKALAKRPAGSLVVVPLVSHAGMIGILYALKDMPYGFFKDDVDVISAFADQATIAIENSRLIRKSIERERLLREITLAQEIQRKLLPQSLPQYRTMELDAVSEPAFEVGGDYYDVVELNDDKLGIVVGDVSGKGVSAAFYMAEVKGIFQSLSRLYPSPREFMIKANEALSGSIDKHSFVSLIYAVVDVTTGRLTLARAGHCPLLHISGEHARYLRPNGMGLGLSNGSAFDQNIEEQTIQLRAGDVCVFYTDGVTEARPPRESSATEGIVSADDEFGYERLLDTIIAQREESACQLKDEILRTVKTHAAKRENDDDLTVVVLKWLA
jgi:serine phosphatase RsbU (regulator of sigma subunit)